VNAGSGAERVLDVPVAVFVVLVVLVLVRVGVLCVL
jgi:hypothetical protein